MAEKKQVKVPQELQIIVDIQKNLAARAWADPKFCALLRKNPAAAIREMYGVELPPTVNLRVIEETATTRYVVVPQKVSLPLGDELSDGELEAVSGGLADKERSAHQAQRTFDAMGTAAYWDPRNWS